MASMKFYFRCLVIVLFILCANARSYNHYKSYTATTYHNQHSYPTSPGQSALTSKHSYPTSSVHSGHSYPGSGGLSGSGHQTSHGYPSSGGLSGSGHQTSHAYPSSGGLSGSGHQTSHSYPGSGGLSGSGHQTSHSYPGSGGLSGSSKPSVSYPASTGLSGTGSLSRNPGSSYPPSNGLSGNSPSTGSSYPHPKITYPVARPAQNVYPTQTHYNTHKEEHHHHHHHTNTHTVVHHHHYDYKPPPVIHYTPAHGMSSVSYPVYSGHHVPSYVYQYRSSNNKYRMLLAGLALYNLGMVSGNPTIYNYHKHYVVRPDEVCKFGVRYEYGSYEEMAIDCRAITNFIWEEQLKPQVTQQVVNQTVVTTNVQTQTLLPNGTLGHPGFGAVTTLSENGTVLNTANTIITTTTTISDPKYQGNPIGVSSGMECYILRFTSYSNMRKTVPCGLLHTYAAQTLKNHGVTVTSPWILIIMTVAIRIAI